MDTQKFIELFKEQDAMNEAAEKELEGFERREAEMKQKLVDISYRAIRCETPYDQLKIAEEWERFNEESKKLMMDVEECRHNLETRKAERTYNLSTDMIQEMKKLALLQMMRGI